MNSRQDDINHNCLYLLEVVTHWKLKYQSFQVQKNKKKVEKNKTELFLLDQEGENVPQNEPFMGQMVFSSFGSINGPFYGAASFG